jgi:hypothetical protein
MDATGTLGTTPGGRPERVAGRVIPLPIKSDASWWTLLYQSQNGIYIDFHAKPCGFHLGFSLVRKGRPLVCYQWSVLQHRPPQTCNLGRNASGPQVVEIERKGASGQMADWKDVINTARYAGGGPSIPGRCIGSYEEWIPDSTWTGKAVDSSPASSVQAGSGVQDGEEWKLVKG